jgi:hypothetical protein
MRGITWAVTCLNAQLAASDVGGDIETHLVLSSVTSTSPLTRATIEGSAPTPASNAHTL